MRSSPLSLPQLDTAIYHHRSRALKNVPALWQCTSNFSRVLRRNSGVNCSGRDERGSISLIGRRLSNFWNISSTSTRNAVVFSNSFSNGIISCLNCKPPPLCDLPPPIAFETLKTSVSLKSVKFRAGSISLVSDCIDSTVVVSKNRSNSVKTVSSADVLLSVESVGRTLDGVVAVSPFGTIRHPDQTLYGDRADSLIIWLSSMLSTDNFWWHVCNDQTKTNFTYGLPEHAIALTLPLL